MGPGQKPRRPVFSQRGSYAVFCFTVSARCPDTFEVILDQSCQRRHNERCSYTCKTGYKPTNISEQNVTCTTSSTWDKTLSTLCKKIKCPATIPHGNISTICSREYNTNCRYYKCDSGYLHPPDWPGLTCNFTGQWEWLQSSTRDFCINEMALCPSRVPGGRVYSSCDRTPLSTCGAICDYGCKDKLYSLSCSRNGEWIGGESACTCTTCPSYVHNGYISGATYGVGPCDFKVGSTCNVKCNEGCTEGVYTAYCDSTGHWSTADVVCDCSDVSTTRTITIVVSILGVIVFLAIVAGVCKSCHRWLSQQPTQRNMVSQSGFQQATLHISSPTNNSQRICENTTSNFRNAGPPLYTELSFTKLDETEPPPPYEDVLSQPKK